MGAELCLPLRPAGKHVKLKVGRDFQDDIRRLTVARESVGPDVNLMIGANLVWEVDEAIE